MENKTTLSEEYKDNFVEIGGGKEIKV